MAMNIVAKKVVYPDSLDQANLAWAICLASRRSPFGEIAAVTRLASAALKVTPLAYPRGELVETLDFP